MEQIVEGVRVDATSASNATVVPGVSCNACHTAALAVPMGPWADLGVSAATSVDDRDSLLPAEHTRSDRGRRARSRDDAEERKIKFIASLSADQKRRIWMRKQWWHQ